MPFFGPEPEVFVKQQRGSPPVLNAFTSYNPTPDAGKYRRKQFFVTQEYLWFTNRTLVIGTAAAPPPPPLQSGDPFIGNDTYGWPEPDPPFVKSQRGYVNYYNPVFVYNPATDPTLLQKQATVFVDPDVFAKRQNQLNLGITNFLFQVVVPDVTGNILVDALNGLSLVGLGGNVVGSQYDNVNPVGTVSAQTPVGGQMAFIGTNVDLIMSLGPAPLPPFPGILLPDAIFIAINAGLVVGQPIVWQYDPVIPYNYVISQTPPAGSTIPQQTVVHFVASLGPNPFPPPGSITVPDFTNLMILDAQQQAIDLGLSRANRVLYVYSSTVPGGYVVTQSLVPGSVVPAATTITFTVSVGTSVTSLPGAQIVTPTMH